jgi:hypothetical protein
MTLGLFRSGRRNSRLRHAAELALAEESVRDRPPALRVLGLVFLALGAFPEAPGER